MNTDDILYRYWDYALKRIREFNPYLFRNNKPVDRNALNGLTDCGIEFVCLANKRKSNIPAGTVAVELYIDGTPDEKERIKSQYDFLVSKRSEIESEIPDLFWNRNSEKRASSIICYKQIDYTDESNWAECAEFHATMMKKMYECAFLPYRDELAILFREASISRPSKSNKLEWFITCDFDEYDIFGAFKEFSRIEWGQPQKLKGAIAGDTVFIFVTGKIGAICFKTHIVQEGLFGIGTIDDFRFQKKKYEPVERRYMILELDESYPANRFTLQKLRERGLKDYYPKELSVELSRFLNGVDDSSLNKEPSIMLSSLLKTIGLDPETTKLVRHSFNKDNARDCYQKGFIEAYQSIQKDPVFHGSTHVLSFMGEEKGKTAVFIGLFEVRGEFVGDHQARTPEGYPYPDEFRNNRYWYDLKRLDDMHDLEGKLKIAWGDAPISWCQKATNDKVVIFCPTFIGSPIMRRIVFCNVAYMRYYDADISEPAPVSGGSFVRENGFGFERNNFHVHESDGRATCRGFVETGHSGEWSSVADSHQLNVSRIDSKGEKDGKVEGVTVVFCASRPDSGCVVVGWYRNAVAYRNVREDGEGNLYSFEADSRDCVLLEEKDRTFKVPRSGRDGFDFGFGRFNVWYADDDSAYDFVSDVMRFIAGETGLPVEGLDEGALNTEEVVGFDESGKPKQATVNTYERNQKARRECLRIHGFRCKVCGFESGSVYGDDFAQKIEVHHVVPISERGGDYKVNPETDLIPVCPNCHAMLHAKTKDGKTLTWQELRARLEERRQTGS